MSKDLIVLAIETRLKGMCRALSSPAESASSHLQFLIDNFFCHYQDKNIALMICDTNKILRFITEMELRLYSFDQAPSSIKKIEQAADYVLASGNTATVIIFDKYDGIIGAVHKYYQPIFTATHEICGFSMQTYDFTKLFWGAKNLTQNVKPAHQKIDFKILTLKQQQILLLLAFNLNQEEIAENLNISRGGVARAASRICKSFEFSFSSTNLLIDTLGRENIISNLSLQSMKFEPCAVLIKNDWKILHNLRKE